MDFLTAGFGAGVAENVLNDREQMGRTAADALQLRDLVLIDGPAHAGAEQLGVAEDGGERRAQLMTHDREEIGFGAIGFLRFLVETRVGDGESRAGRERFGEFEIVVVVPPLALRQDEGEHAQSFAANLQGHDHGRAQLQPAQQLEVLGIARGLPEQFRGDFRIDLRLAAADDAPGRGVVGWIAFPQLAHEAQHIGIDVRDVELLELAAVVDETERTPIGNAGHGQPDDCGQRGLVIERGGEQAAGFGQETLAIAGILGPLARRFGFVGTALELLDRSLELGGDLLELAGILLERGLAQHGIGHVLPDVDGKTNLALRIQNRLCLDQRPARFAGSQDLEAHQARFFMRALQRFSAGQPLGRQHRAGFVVERESPEDLARRCGQQLGRRIKAGQARGGRVRVDEPATGILHGDTVGDAVQDGEQLVGVEGVIAETQRSELVRHNAERQTAAWFACGRVAPG